MKKPIGEIGSLVLLDDKDKEISFVLHRPASPVMQYEFGENKFSKITASLKLDPETKKQIDLLTQRVRDQVYAVWKVKKYEIKDPIYKNSIQIKFPYSATAVCYIEKPGQQHAETLDCDYKKVNEMFKGSKIAQVNIEPKFWYKLGTDGSLAGGLFFTLQSFATKK
jgi:hypothetical protein